METDIDNIVCIARSAQKAFRNNDLYEAKTERHAESRRGWIVGGDLR